jgi:hypothetical protein
MARFSEIRDVPGVYLLLDLDEQPLYAGKSGSLRSRLMQHFVRQDSSATADGLLDVYEVMRVLVWYAAPEFPLEAYEAALVQAHTPRWNRGAVVHTGALPALALDMPDAVVGLLDSPEQLAVRREPLERIETKLLHLLRAVRKARISGASPATLAALSRHADELKELFGSRAKS